VAPRLLQLPDGRSLEIDVSGPDGGQVLLFHHGTPGGVLQRRYFAEAVGKRGWRFVTYSRAGYGRSDRNAGRSVADVVIDVEAVLDHLGVDRFLVAGASGGGPHTLACAALLPHRVSAAMTIAGVGPYGAADLDFLAGMGQDNLDEFGLALQGEVALRPYLEAQAAEIQQADAAAFVEVLSSLLPEVDRAVLTGELGEETVAAMQYAIARSVDGWVDDDLAFTRHWGFELADIGVPVSVWQGDADLMVPFAHGQWLSAAVPGARVHLEAGEGHLSITIGAIERMLDDLAALAPDLT
jgi:pimeloyl-ACP methyl ester carboxylesterase